MVLAAFVFLIAMAASPLGAAVEGQGAGSTEEIRGKTTLAEIEKEYQVPAAFLIERLKLPKETGLNEPLKDLKDRHGFEMETVRTLVRDHQTGKDLAKVEAAVAAGGASAGKQTEHKGHQPAAVSTVAMMLALYAFFCIVMLLLLRKNRVGQGVRLAVLAVSLLVFGVLFKSQTEPVRAISQVFQALGMGRYGVLDTLLVFLAFTLMTLVGVKLICGWGCPAGTLQEVLYHLPWFAKIKKRRAPFWLSNALRIVLFIVFLIFVFGWIPGFRDQSIYRYFNPFKLFEWNFNVTAPITIAVIFALSMIHYRVYCLWICPFGLFSWLIQDASIFRVRVNHGTCIDCGKCVRACPTDAAKGIYEGKAIKVDCFSCARCLTACPNGSLQYRSWEGDKDQSDQA
jgi:NAD-dependent dihydropyrimidine dehydrogenase PreA subunit